MGDRSVLLAADAKPHRGATRDRYQSPRAFLARDSRPEGCCMDCDPSRGLMSRAKRFREAARQSVPFDMEVYFDRVDLNPDSYLQ